MRAINHALTGAIIGLTVGEPVVALPVALVSHFVCDIIPHHGSQKPNKKALTSTVFRNALIVDAWLCLALVIVLAASQPIHWSLAAICAFTAASPDFLYINRYLTAVRHKSWRPSAFVKWAIDIQWFQRPIGVVVEAAWFVAAVALLLPFIR